MQTSLRSTTLLLAATATLLCAVSQLWNHDGTQKSAPPNKATTDDDESDGCFVEEASNESEGETDSQNKAAISSARREGSDRVDRRELRTVSKIAPFPWENWSPDHAPSRLSDAPRESAEKPSKPEPPTSPAHTTSSYLSAAGQISQLDFLASMTFANGGLRSPSCPCCM